MFPLLNKKAMLILDSLYWLWNKSSKITWPCSGYEDMASLSLGTFNFQTALPKVAF